MLYYEVEIVGSLQVLALDEDQAESIVRGNLEHVLKRVEITFMEPLGEDYEMEPPDSYGRPPQF